MRWRLDPAAIEEVEALRYVPGEERFEIVVPENANIAADTVGRHAAGPRAHRTALLFEDSRSTVHRTTYAELDEAATRFAVRLASLGVSRGATVAVHSVQRPETVIAHLGIYKLGAIATTISPLTGPYAMRHILTDCGARVIVTHDAAWGRLRSHRGESGSIEHVIVAGDAKDGELRFAECLQEDTIGFEPAATRSEDPALLIYTSGSTGMPKGILHAHRILHALNATIELFYDLELREPDLVLWTAADWAWMGGLNDVVFPALTYGHTLAITQQRYDPDGALHFMARHGVTHILLTPTALKRLVQIPESRPRADLRLRVVFTGGEPLPGETHRALTHRFGVICNEGYGMTEVNQMIGNCRKLRPIRPGSMGWEFPGHRVALVDDDGREVPDGEVGEIVVGADDPTLFLGYFGRPDLTERMRLGVDWVRTGDLARRDEDGYYWYQGRNDDLIKSAGYRIGPVEVEEVLLEHPAVADAGVIGVPDDGDRGMLVKACVRLAEGESPSDALAEALKAHVRERLGAYKQPRLVTFVDALPTTSTGKVSRAELRRRDRQRERGHILAKGTHGVSRKRRIGTA